MSGVSRLEKYRRDVFTGSICLIPASQYQGSRCKQHIAYSTDINSIQFITITVAGPTIWNNLPECLRDPELSIDNFRRQLKTFLFAQY